MTQFTDVDAIPQGLTEAELVRAVRGTDPRVQPIDALKHLGRLRSKELAGVATAILADKKADRRLRATAFTAVAAALDRKAAQALILASLDPADQTVFRHAVAELGRTGTGEALERLEKIEAIPGTASAAALAFARTLLSHRLRSERHQIELPPESLRLKAQKAKAQPVEVVVAEPSAAEFRAFQTAAHGLAVARRGALAFTCAGRRLRLLPVEPFTTAAEIATLAQKPGLLMTLFTESLSLDTPAMLATFLARPGAKRGEIAIVGVASHGQPVYFGSAKRASAASEVIQFSFQSVASVYSAPIEIAGSFDLGAKKLALSDSISEGAIDTSKAAPREPARVVR